MLEVGLRYMRDVSDYINEFDQPLTFQCPNDGFITGTESVHDNRKEDRRFKFQCCEIQGGHTAKPMLLGLSNNNDKSLRQSHVSLHPNTFVISVPIILHLPVKSKSFPLKLNFRERQ